MNWMEILIATGVVAGVGITLGILLGVAGKFLLVEADEKELAVRACLPGVNCGACGYTGCDAYAKAVVEEDAPINRCTVAGNEGAQKIGDIMGKVAEEIEPYTAVVCCSGSCEHTNAKYIYDGIPTCEAAVLAPGGGQQACSFACLGFGSCAKVCSQNAISIVNGVAVVDETLCHGCGQCVKACPKNLIIIREALRPYTVRCSSHDKGKEVKAVCDTGCIGCGICAKNCPAEAITVEGNLARINYEKCVDCGACAEKCPVKIIY